MKKKNHKPGVTVPNKGFHIEFKHPSQKLAWNCFLKHDILFLSGPSGTGKAQPLDSIVYTPNGPKKMGDIKCWDEVCTPDGKKANVIGVFPQGKKQVYKITFNDGTSTRCCKEHLWQISAITCGWKNKIVNTEYILNNYRSKNKRKFSIQTTQPVLFNDNPLLIHPYLMGLLLGDGSFRCSSLRFSTSDLILIEKINEILDKQYECVKLKNRKYDYVIRKKIKNGEKNCYINALRYMNLWKKNSWEKHIPCGYIYNSVENRMLLLQGLMDTDGTVDKKTGCVSYCTTSEVLTKNIQELVESLGGTCKIKQIVKKFRYNGCLKQGRMAYNCYIKFNDNSLIFGLKRKKKLCKPIKKYFTKRMIDKVELDGEEECQCILIDSMEHLYLTDNFIVTHNTHLATAFAVQQVLANEKRKIIITRPIVEAGEKLGYLPGTFDEKVMPYMMPIYDCLDKLVGGNPTQLEQIEKKVEIAPIAYLRGRTLSDAICIFDEAQNATYTQIKLFLTRMGENCKLIITGDPKQSDLMQDNVPLVDIMLRLKEIPGIGFIEFKPNAIVRHPLVGQMLEKLE